MKLIVFDFDKTLTNYDTMTSFIVFNVKKNLFKWPIFPVYLMLKLMAKFKVISIQKEKELSLLLFVPRNWDRFTEECNAFSKTIKLNEVHKVFKEETAKGNRIVILSASPEVYLKSIFPDNEVIGTTFNIMKNDIVSINQHPYGGGKIKALVANGITAFDDLYYDSKSDEVLLPMSKKSFLVKNGKIV